MLTVFSASIEQTRLQKKRNIGSKTLLILHHRHPPCFPPQRRIARVKVEEAHSKEQGCRAFPEGAELEWVSSIAYRASCRQSTYFHLCF
jgi:hypothetical protein